MTSPDAAQDRAYEAATAISVQVGHLWMEAHVQGMRAGIDVAADAIHNLAESVVAQPDVFDQMSAGDVVFTLRKLRDEVRLMALSLPEPEVSDGAH
ncbi:hypothetical protein H7K45_27885 [Mycobacterium yunnanensis]|uniref:Uncharacterized protein n=1 Tax=Mycobacterium yunnanensis TaxID=368477 RepID=A0A9X3C5D5_9MYCO|nr:hypothetical protein [Mycobacterium yunnanensis]MCV7424372.1 hypothetical protein [Mycobacterium yunnanensis]